MTDMPEACVIESWLGTLQRLVGALEGSFVPPLLRPHLRAARVTFGEMGTDQNVQVRRAHEQATEMLAIVGDGFAPGKPSPEFVEQKRVLLSLLDDLVPKLESCLVPSIMGMYHNARLAW